MLVNTSAARKESQMPVKPNKNANTQASAMIATKPLNVETKNASFALVIALKQPAATTLNPAKKQPVKYNRSPVKAYSAISIE